MRGKKVHTCVHHKIQVKKKFMLDQENKILLVYLLYIKINASSSCFIVLMCVTFVGFQHFLELGCWKTFHITCTLHEYKYNIMNVYECIAHIWAMYTFVWRQRRRETYLRVVQLWHAQSRQKGVVMVQKQLP